jgi:phosphoglycolate phosphatase
VTRATPGTPRLAIFDCDGTLVDSGADICAAMDRSFAHHGLAAPAHKHTRRIVGLSLPQALAVLAPEGDAPLHASLAEGYKSAFHAMRGEGVVAEPLYEGIAEVIDSLAADGWMLGVATGKSDRGLALCLERHDLGGHFVTLQTADRHPSKPHPSMIEAALAGSGVEAARCAMIGDTSYDMAMARAAGCRAVGVTWGYHSQDDLRDAGADAIAHRPADLLAILDTIA